MRELVLDDRSRFRVEQGRGEGGDQGDEGGEGGSAREGDDARLATDVAEEVIAGAREDATAVTAHEADVRDLCGGRSSGDGRVHSCVS